jgi:hypothetical protein
MISSRHHRPMLGNAMLCAVFSLLFLQGAAQAQSLMPVITQILPDSLPQGGPEFTLTVMGDQFDPNATVQWNGLNLITSFLGTGTLQATVPASDIVSPDFIAITVMNPDGGISNSMTFTILIVNPVPLLADTSPSTALAGGAGFDLTVFGQGFTTQSVVLWNGTPRTTYYRDSGTLIASITADDIANPSTSWIAVQDTGPGGAISDSQRFIVTQASTLYFPQVAVGGGYTTIFTLVNNGTQSTSGTLTVTGQGGNPFLVDAADSSGNAIPASSFSFSIPGGGTQTITVTAPNPGDPVMSGWAHVDSDSSSLTGEATFETSQGSVLTSVAGVLPAQPANSVTIPVDDDAGTGRRTGIAVANPTANAVNVQLMVLDENGVVVDSISPPQLNPLAPGRQIAWFLDEFLPQRSTFKGSLILAGNSPDDQFVSMALLISPGLTSQGLMSAFPVDVLKGTAEKFSTVYFPQIAVGGAYSTSITLLNTGTQDAIASLTLTDQSGNPLSVSGAESDNPPVTASTFSFVIPAGGSRMYTFNTSDPGAAVKSGWARVDSSSNMLTGVTTFQTTEENVLTSVAGVLPTQPAHEVTIPIENDAGAGRRTGFALANGGADNINVQIKVLDENGNQMDSISPPQLNPLGPGQQVAKFLDEFLPDLATFKGSVQLVGQGAGDRFESVALQFTPGLTGLGLMTVVPIIQ